MPRWAFIQLLRAVCVTRWPLLWCLLCYVVGYVCVAVLLWFVSVALGAAHPVRRVSRTVRKYSDLPHMYYFCKPKICVAVAGNVGFSDSS